MTALIRENNIENNESDHIYIYIYIFNSITVDNISINNDGIRSYVERLSYAWMDYTIGLLNGREWPHIITICHLFFNISVNSLHKVIIIFSYP